MDRRGLLQTALRVGRGVTAARLLPAAGAVAIGTAGCAEVVDVPDPVDAVLTRWSQDPWARGSYSYLRVGSTPADRAALREPVGPRLLLAGEATDRDFPATVHGALASGVRAAEQLLTTGVADALVVGAGAAGLAAAATLDDAGVDVRVVEARDRTGGRVDSVQRWGTVLERGASWIHGLDDNPLVDLAEDADVSLSPFDYDDLDLRDRQGGDRGAYATAAEVEHELGADVADISPSAGEEGEELGGGDALVVGGYARLLSGLGLDDLVTTGWPVTRVVHSASGVRLEGPAGQMTADGAILTLPLGVLQAGDVLLDPPLPPAATQAVGRLGMGVLDKCILRFDDVFWDPEVALIGIVPSTPGEWVEWVNLLPVTGQPLLMGFNAGSVARRVADLSDDEVVGSATAALRSAFS